jgi:hypothetical protein
MLTVVCVHTFLKFCYPESMVDGLSMFAMPLAPGIMRAVIPKEER